MIKRDFSIIIHFFIIIFWVSVISVFLFSPVIKRFLIKERSLSIYTWSDTVGLDKVAEFEKKTGIKVKISYYENNEELFSKLRVTRSQDYDLMMVTDVAVDAFVTRPSLKGMLKKIDKSKLKFWSDIEPLLFNHYFDPNNEYSIPYYWDVYGIGVNKKFFKEVPKTWGLIFDPNIIQNKVVMLDDALEGILSATKYLFSSIEDITPKKIELIKNVLFKQKQFVLSYTDLRADYFLISGAASAAIAQGGFIVKAMNIDKNISFVIPSEGSFVVIDSWVMPSTTDKEDMIYEFLNFIYQDNIVKDFVEEYKYLPSNKNVLRDINLSYLGENILSPEEFNKHSFFKRTISVEDACKLWIALKSY